MEVKHIFAQNIKRYKEVNKMSHYRAKCQITDCSEPCNDQLYLPGDCDKLMIIVFGGGQDEGGKEPKGEEEEERESEKTEEGKGVAEEKTKRGGQEAEKTENDEEAQPQ